MTRQKIKEFLKASNDYELKNYVGQLVIESYRRKLNDKDYMKKAIKSISKIEFPKLRERLKLCLTQKNS